VTDNERLEGARAALAGAESRIKELIIASDGARWMAEQTKAALLGVAHALGDDGWCWCAYTTLVHPPDDPQDGVPVEANGHTKECNAARSLIPPPQPTERSEP